MPVFDPAPSPELYGHIQTQLRNRTINELMAICDGAFANLNHRAVGVLPMGAGLLQIIDTFPAGNPAPVVGLMFRLFPVHTREQNNDNEIVANAETN